MPLEVRVDDGRCGDEEEDGERLPREPSHGATPELARYRLKYRILSNVTRVLAVMHLDSVQTSDVEMETQQTLTS